jgi:anaerobic ribonucleoside-triphosphate reductase activating protein
MRYHQIRKMDISNGPGIRVSIFVQGCTFKCKNCFNPETHDFNGGVEFTDEVISKILELASPEYICGLSILGGEPMHPKNIDGTLKLACAFKEKYPDKNVWVWSGFLFEDLMNQENLKYVDVLVDGRYVDSKHHPNLKWRGSTNQRVIDVKKSLKSKIIRR